MAEAVEALTRIFHQYPEQGATGALCGLNQSKIIRVLQEWQALLNRGDCFQFYCCATVTLTIAQIQDGLSERVVDDTSTQVNHAAWIFATAVDAYDITLIFDGARPE